MLARGGIRAIIRELPVKITSMKKETFEDFLKTKHAENYMGTDDAMGEDFECYLEDIEKDEMLELADEWTKNVIEFAQIKIKQIKGVYSAYDALTEVDKVLETLK